MKQLQWQSEQHQAQQEAAHIQHRKRRKSPHRLNPKSKHTNTEQADLFRTKARYIHLFFANGKADTIKDIGDIDSKDKHGFKKFSGKDIDRKVEHDCQNKQFKDRYKSQVKPDCKQSKT